MKNKIEDKIEAFAGLVETETIQRLSDHGLACQGNIDREKTRVHFGKKYARVDNTTSGRFMVEMSTGNIFGIKGYGVIHKGHFYGTVDTTAEWSWGGYYPIRKDGTLARQKGNSCPVLTHAPELVVA